MVGTNLFFHRGPVREPAYFFGRKQEISQLFDMLICGQCISISGQRRLGKTSMLFYIATPEIAAKHGLDPPQTLWVYLDGGMLDGLDEDAVYGAIDRCLQKNRPESVPYEVLLGHIRGLAAQEQRLIIILDEFEVFTQNESLLPRFFNRLRGLAAQFPVQFIIASKDPLSKLTFANSAVVSSSFFNIFVPFHLSLYQEQEAREMLTTLSERSGSIFESVTIDFLLELVGPHPHFLQVAGYHAFEHQHNGALSAMALSAVKERTIDELEGHLEYYWRNLSTEEQYTLATLQEASFESSSPIITHLRDSGLIYEKKLLGMVLKIFIVHQNVPGLLSHGSFVMDERRRLLTVDGKLVHLTPTEFAALRLLMQNPGRLLTPDDIEANLWPDEIAPDPERARGIMKKLRVALGEAGEAVVTQRGQGYCLS
jgi:Novel STAND NTPase 2